MGGRRRQGVPPLVLVAALVAAAGLVAPSAAVATTGSEGGSGRASNISKEQLGSEFSAVLSLRVAPDAMCLVVLLDDELIVEAQGDAALVPASLMKIVTAVAALEVMGPDGVYTTEVFVRSDDLASAADGTLRGDVYLLGGGDPVLNTPRYGERIPDPVSFTDVSELADRVSQSLTDRGIRRIVGRIVGDDSRYPDRVRDYYREIPPGGREPVWRYTVDTLNYVGPLSGLLINDGFTSYTWRTATADRREYTRAADPARHAASVFDSLLEGRGVPITRRPRSGVAPQPADRTSLGAIDSPPVSEIVARMLSRSDNTIAEMMLKEVGRQTLGSSRAIAAAVVDGTVRRILGPLAAGIRVVDGSGVSRHNRLTCHAVAELLRRAGRHSPLVQGLSVVGERGTLKACRPGAPPAGRVSLNPVHVKTGTLYLSNALAGVAGAPSGEAVTFAMIANGHNMGELDTCHALRMTLVDAAARYRGPIPPSLGFHALSWSPSP